MVTVVDAEALSRARGAANYLTKPIDRDRLAVVLERFSSRREAHDERVEVTRGSL
jgi:response regulator of citrate/malate metabolism